MNDHSDGEAAAYRIWHMVRHCGGTICQERFCSLLLTTQLLPTHSGTTLETLRQENTPCSPPTFPGVCIDKPEVISQSRLLKDGDISLNRGNWTLDAVWYPTRLIKIELIRLSKRKGWPIGCRRVQCYIEVGPVGD